MTTALTDTFAPDAAVPERDALLDPAVFVASVADEAPAEVVAGERLRARYQVGRSLRVLHEVEVEGEHCLLAARTFRGDVSEIARKANEHAVPTRPLPPVIPLRELSAVAWVYPNDRKLRDLPELASTVATVLRRERVELGLVAWAPEKSATVRCDRGANVLAYAKAYVDADATLERSFHDELRARLTFSRATSIPRPLGGSENVLVLEPAQGTPLALLRSVPAVAAYARYGRALAALHSLAPLPAAKPFTRFDRDEVRLAATLIGRARPDVAEDAQALARTLVERRPGPTGWACLHGDAHPKNALDDGERITLIDLEQVAAGDPASELGGVLAAIEYRSVTGQLNVQTGVSHQRAFLDAYAESAPLPAAAAIAWNTAAALLAERAIRAVTRVRAEGLRDLPALLRLARATLSGEAS